MAFTSTDSKYLWPVSTEVSYYYHCLRKIVSLLSVHMGKHKLMSTLYLLYVTYIWKYVGFIRIRKDLDKCIYI